MTTLGEGRSVCHSNKMHFRAWRAHQMRKLTPLVTPWTKIGENLVEGGRLVYKPN